jgi:hypothetical protein
MGGGSGMLHPRWNLRATPGLDTSVFRRMLGIRVASFLRMPQLLRATGLSLNTEDGSLVIVLLCTALESYRDRCMATHAASL